MAVHRLRKIRGAGSCIGVCEDRKVEFVYASAYEGANARAVVLLRHSQALEAVVRRLACTTPRKNEWERSYRALQNEARMTLEALSLDSTEGM